MTQDMSNKIMTREITQRRRFFLRECGAAIRCVILLLLMVVGATEVWGQFLGYIFGLDHVQRVCAKIDRLKPVQNYTHRFDLRQGHGGNSQCKDRQLFDTNQAFPQGINKR